MMDSEKPSEPDSTTLEKDVRQEFRKDEDVLCLNNKDGCFYLGTVVQVDPIYKRCLVEFLDNTKTWSSFKDLKSFAPQESDICYICKKSQSKSDNKIIVCKCGRACHQHCHEPVIQSSSISNWKCKICEPTIKQREERVSKRISSNKLYGPPTSISQLPYNLDSLTWDTHHRINQEGRYCYCGEHGFWNTKMLQCRRCRQWFHSRCISTVSHPVFCGDRFYVFVCSICNNGKEYTRRLALKWPDLVHLVLYNLTLIHQTKYYDLEEAILPFVNTHWNDLQLPPSMAKATIDERRTQILDALITCEKRFKCGREIKKRANIWGLRVRGAPKTPPLSLPPKGPIDDNVLRVYCKKNIVTPEADAKPLQNGYINSSQAGSRQSAVEKSHHKIVPPIVINVPKPYSTTATYTVIDKEVATKYNDNLTTDSKVISSTEYHGRGLVKRSTPFPPQDQANNLDTRFRSHAVRKARRLLNKNMKRKKKTVQTSVLSSKSESDSSDERSESVSQKYSDSCEEFADTRKRSMELRKRVTQPEVRKRPQRNLLEARLNSTESKLYNPFVSVDSSETRKSRSSVNNDNNRKSVQVENSPRKSKNLKGKANDKVKGNNSKTKYVQRSIYESFNLKVEGKPKLELVPLCTKYKESENTESESKGNNVKVERVTRSWGCSTSETLDRTHGEFDLCGLDTTDDETSSRGTLEPFIPTPKDFEGQNNPFRSVTDLINTAAGVPPAPNPHITLPLPLKTVIPHVDPPRLKKRQLSEKDIIIDRNGQVKRRRRHRKNPNGLVARSLSHGTAAKTAQIVPGKNNKKPWSSSTSSGPHKEMLQSLANNCVDYALNVRQLRNRESLKGAGDKGGTQAQAAKPSPVKQSSSTSSSKESPTLCEDLESSVKYFFGTASRIANGEKYEVRAKRITFDGRLQCIIEWKSFPT